MNEQQLQQLGQQLAAIELPPEPNWWPLIWIVSLFLIGQTVITLIMLKKRKSASNNNLHNEAQHRLKQIQQQWQNGELEPRDAAYQLATLLRLGMGLKQLEPSPPDYLKDQAHDWQSIIEQLQQLRYQADSDATLNERLFATIQAWLKQGAKAC